MTGWLSSTAGAVATLFAAGAALRLGTEGASDTGPASVEVDVFDATGADTVCGVAAGA
jgi:hypothetical protein